MGAASAGLLLILSTAIFACDCDCDCCQRSPSDTRHCCGGSDCGACCFARGIPVATFDGHANHSWTVENDPVMGGQSVSSWHITSTANGTAVGAWEGVCRIVPSLDAPGFVFARTDKQLTARFPPLWMSDGLLLTMRNIVGNVTLFQVAFCDSRLNPYRCQFGTYKANFTLPPAPMASFATVHVPWTRFSDKWSRSTGKHTAEHPPPEASLSKVSQVQIWVEGMAGRFSVELEGIRARCKSSDCM